MPDITLIQSCSSITVLKTKLILSFVLSDASLDRGRGKVRNRVLQWCNWCYQGKGQWVEPNSSFLPLLIEENGHHGQRHSTKRSFHVVRKEAVLWVAPSVELYLSHSRPRRRAPHVGHMSITRAYSVHLPSTCISNRINVVN